MRGEMDMSKKFIGYSNDVDEIMDLLEEAGAFEEEEGGQDTLQEKSEEA